jgi:hypothetical protein
MLLTMSLSKLTETAAALWRPARLQVRRRAGIMRRLYQLLDEVRNITNTCVLCQGNGRTTLQMTREKRFGWPDSRANLSRFPELPFQ